MFLRLSFGPLLCYNMLNQFTAFMEVHMLDARVKNEQVDDLARAMIELNDMDEAYSFFEDIFTIHELQAVAQRLAVARLLRQKVTYQEIAERTGASTATISRVNRCLTYGAGGYQRILNKLDALDASAGSEAKEE